MKTKVIIVLISLLAVCSFGWIDEPQQNALVRELHTRYYNDLLYASWFESGQWYNPQAAMYFRGRASSDYQSLVNLASVTGDDSIIPR